jgi:hypothetical protein
MIRVHCALGASGTRRMLVRPATNWILLVLLALTTLGSATARADATDPTLDQYWYSTNAAGEPVIRLYYFYSPTCPHCQAAKPWLDELPQRMPWLEIQRLTIKDNRKNARQYYETARSLGVEALSTPGFIFCRQVRIGFDTPETTGSDLEQEIEECRARRLAGEPDPLAAPRGASSTDTGRADEGGTTVHLPLVGRVDASSLSLPILTVVLAGVDAFNPCAFFVLLFLLSLLVHAKSRARMLIVGGTFVLFSGLVYFVFMAAWLNVFLIAGELRIMTFAAGLLALMVAALNIKDYFWFKQGASLSIPESAKPGLFKRMRGIVVEGSLGPMLFSTVVLAIVANSYELLCTAGFPMVYTRALTLANLESWQHYAYLAAYNVIYVLPLLAIVLVFTRTMGSRKLTESEGRTLKLVSGFMMLGFGLMLLIAPQQLTNAVASILVLGAAVGLALVIARLVPAPSA